MSVTAEDSVESRFRQSWRGFGSSIALVATNSGDTRYVMLATAATSVSMEPPSVMICINRSASAHCALIQRKAFSLGIMKRAQSGIAAEIARASSEARAGIGTWNAYQTPGRYLGLPWMEECQASLICETDASMEYGTHTVMIAKVRDVIMEDSVYDPLMYCDGKFGTFGPL